MPHLQVLVGPDRFNLEPCRVNDTQRPHEINTEHFVGRVLVRVLDAPGAKEGEPGREYFLDRSRKFCIQIEGRFKQRWSGEQVHFGTDFDKFIDFPRAPFNAGMRIAKMIDPCTFYELHPPSGRPYIMSPYIACMNTICAWPAPSREHDAVVVLRHTHRSGSPDSSNPVSPIIHPEKGDGNPHGSLVASPVGSDAEEEGDIVPTESLDRSHSADKAAEEDAAKKKKKKGGWFGGFGLGGGSGHKEERVLKRYWRFVGFQQDPRVRALLEAHDAKLRGAKASAKQLSVSSNGSASSPAAADVQHAPAGQTLSRLGIGKRRELGHTPDRPGTPEHAFDKDDPAMPMSPTLGFDEMAIAAPGDLNDDSDKLPQPKPTTTSSSTPASASSTTESKPEMPKLERIATTVRNEFAESAKTDGLRDGDFKLANALSHPSSNSYESKLDAELGPWRFTDPGTDMIEDNAFIFTNQSLPVPKRRRHFASEKARKDFQYDPDVVYGASFFTDAFDFNTFNLGIGPVRLNIARFFTQMPVRYTLRSSTDEELTFATISFQLVDD